MFRVVTIALCAVITAGYSYNSEYTRIKRAKYYPSPPFKFYNRPPFSPPIIGPFSYTPPPGYTASDEGRPTPSKPRPYKVSKRPSNDNNGLGDEDISNLVKYLWKKDLDKIVDIANEKEKFSERYREPSDENNYEYRPDFDNNDNIPYKDRMRESDRNVNKQIAPANENRYYSSDNDVQNSKYTEYKGPVPIYQADQAPLYTDESRPDEQFSFVDAYIQKEIRNSAPNNAYIHRDIGHVAPDKNSVYTDSTTMQEEQLPLPANLRQDDYQVSFTNDVVSVVQPETSSYKLENFAELPLMNYENSKLHTVNSYSVPHYSVTSEHRPVKATSSFSSPLLKPSYNTPEVEPAPPSSAGKEQSDAHLKAIKIWTHKSKGTAYTLHDDGTLSLERPARPIFNYN